jgi:hypothetical protein
MDLEYTKTEVVRLSDYYNEEWLKTRIEEDTTLLGLGDLNVIKREREQSTGGRIDFLMSDPETETMYEIEVMLGATDESHIIRTIEYWDIEKRRFPDRDHKAVIIAEEITRRFFNVISLMSLSIPIIAIQFSAIKIDGKLTLLFIPVLDLYEGLAYEDLIEGELVGRQYWENKVPASSMDVVDGIISKIKGFDPNIRISYNKGHIALGTHKRNFIWLHPRKTEGYCHVVIKTEKANIDGITSYIENSGMSFNPKKEGYFGVRFLRKNLDDNAEEIVELLKIIWEPFS